MPHPRPPISPRAGLAAAVILALVACKSATPSSPPTTESPSGGLSMPSASGRSSSTASLSPRESLVFGVHELAAAPAPLPAGTYTRSAFRPAVTLHVDGTWTSVNRFDDFFDVEQDIGSPDVIAVQIARPKQLAGKVMVPVPSDPAGAIATLRANPDLHVVSESVSDVGGLNGRVVEIQNTSGHHAAVMLLSPGTLGIDTTRKLWVAFFATPDGLVAVMVGGSIAKWQPALAAAEPVLESIRFRVPASPAP
jgi:hypothetical protein